jgi:mycothiol synthase
MSQFFEVRPGTDADAVPLCEFLNDCTLVHQGISRSSPPDLVARLHLEGADPRLDSFVALADGAIVGFAHLWAHGSDEVKFFARTHPEARGRGIGSRLLSLCDRRAAGLLPGAQRTTTTWAADVSAPPLLEAQGYRPIRYFVTMEIAADSVSEDAPVWPAGFERVRLSERPDLAGALYAAWNEAFAGHWGSQVESEAEFWEERRDAKFGSAFPFEPELWLLALDGGEVVGFCLCELGASDGELVGRVAEVGVVPARRGAGLGLALLRDGFRELRGNGTVRIVLDVDAENATSALRLYERVGMTPRPAFTVWEKPAGTSVAQPV